MIADDARWDWLARQAALHDDDPPDQIVCWEADHAAGGRPYENHCPLPRGDKGWFVNGIIYVSNEFLQQQKENGRVIMCKSCYKKLEPTVRHGKVVFIHEWCSGRAGMPW